MREIGVFEPRGAHRRLRRPVNVGVVDQLEMEDQTYCPRENCSQTPAALSGETNTD